MRGQTVKALQSRLPDGLVDVVAAVEQQVTAIVDRKLGMALESNHLTAYPERFVLAETAGGTQDSILWQDGHLVVVAVE